MKDEQQNNQPITELETSQSWWHIWKKLKNSIFDVLFVLLDNSEDQESMFSIIFQTGVDYIQMMAFPFASAVIDVWGAADTLNGVTNFFTRFNVSTYLPGVSFDTFLALMYTLIFLIIVVITDIAYVAYSFSKKRFTFTFPLIFMAKVVPIFVTVLFLPIMQTLLQVVNCQRSQDGTHQILSSYPDVICWEGWHLFHTTITLLFSTLFVFASCIVALALFQPRMTTNRLTARQNSTGQVVFIINKIICQFIFSFSPFQGSLPYCILLFALSAWLFSAYNLTQPYYDKRASKFFRICSSYYFWTNLVLLASSLLAPFGFNDGLVIWICGMIFIGITIIFQRKSNIDTLFSSSLKFKSGQELESHLKYVLQLHHSRNEDKNSYMLLLGYIQKHIQLCLQEDCPLKHKKKKFVTGKQEEQYTCRQLLKQIERMFEYGIKKYPQCTKLRLTFAFFYMEKQNNTKKAYLHFMKALTTQPSFGQQFIIYRFTKIINEKLQENKQNNEDDLIQIIRFDNHVALCKEGMLASGKLHKQFWIQLKEESPILNRLNKIGAKIIKTTEIIKQNYEEVYKLSGNGLSIIDLQTSYALYLFYVSHEKQECKKLLQILNQKLQTKRIKQEKMNISQSNNRMHELLNSKKCLVVTELEQHPNSENLWSKIIQINRSFIELTKYPQKQLMHKKLQKILPKFLQNYHDIKISQWLSNSHEKIQSCTINQRNSQLNSRFNCNLQQGYIGQERMGYIRDSSGFVKKVKYIVHYFHQESKFVTEFKLLPGGAILCDNEGIILEYCPSVLLRLPDIGQVLSLQDLLGRDVLQELRQSSNKSMHVSVESAIKSKLRRLAGSAQFQLQILQMLMFSKKVDSKKLIIDQLFTCQGETIRRQIGIIVTIKQRKVQISSVMTIKPNLHNQRWNDEPSKNNSRRTNLVCSITWAIQTLYTGMQEAKQNQKSGLSQFSQHRRKGVSLMKQEHLGSELYEKYVNQEGKQCAIKVYRYMDGQMVRLYSDNLFQESSDYDFQQKMADLQAKLTIQKIKDPKYQKSVKKALNTSICYPQIFNLFLMTLFIFIIFMFLNIFSFNHYKTHTMQSLIGSLSQLGNEIGDVQLITSSLLQVIYNDQSQNQTALLNGITNHSITFNRTDFNQSSMINQYVSENRSIIDISINNALIRIQANVARFFEIKEKYSGTQYFNLVEREMDTVFYSYLMKVMQRVVDSLIFNYQMKSNKQFPVNKLVLTLICTVLISTLFVGFWVYTSLKVNHNVSKILIWFLDVPLDYIFLAEKQCLRYFKICSQPQSKKSLLKSLESTEQKKQHTNNNNEDDQEESQKIQQGEKTQSFKTRQLIISRYQKRKVIQFFHSKQILKLLALFFLIGFQVLILVLHMQAQIRVQKASEVILVYVKEYIWISAFPIVQKIKIQQQKNSSSWKIFQLEQLQQLQVKILTEINHNQNEGIKKLQKDIIMELQGSNDLGILTQPSKFQYSNICEFVSNQIQCESIIQGRLKGGYSIFKDYIDQSDRLSQSILADISQSIVSYIGPRMFDILQGIAQSEVKHENDYDFIISLIFYFYTVVIFVFFLVPWSFYLRTLNKKLNQTVQILNIFPIHLIPVHRQATRKILKWIITKSSQVQYD